MRYVSTRGGAKTYSFEEAIIAGWADNGGMILPQSFPRFTADALKAMRSVPFGLATHAHTLLCVPRTHISPLSSLLILFVSCRWPT